MALKYKTKKELSSACIRVEIRSIINPITFWVSEWHATGSPGREKIKRMEDALVKLFQPSSYTSRNLCFLPEVDEMVAVQDPDTGQCYRGIVKEIILTMRHYIYCVFLMDRGSYLKVPNSSLIRLPKYLTEQKKLAYQIGLFGILPTTVDMDYETMKMERTLCTEWPYAANNFVNNLIKNNRFAYFEIKMVKKRKYGDLFLAVENGYINLGEVLCEAEYAVQEDNMFKELVIVDESNLVCDNVQVNGAPSKVISDSESTAEMTKFQLLESYVKQFQDEKAKLRMKNRSQIEAWRQQSSATNLEKVEDDFISEPCNTPAKHSIDKTNSRKEGLMHLLENGCSPMKKSSLSAPASGILEKNKSEVNHSVTEEKMTASGYIQKVVSPVRHLLSATSMLELLHVPEKKNILNEKSANSTKSVIKRDKVQFVSGMVNGIDSECFATKSVNKSPCSPALIPAGFNVSLLNSRTLISPSTMNRSQPEQARCAIDNASKASPSRPSSSIAGDGANSNDKLPPWLLKHLKNIVSQRSSQLPAPCNVGPSISTCSATASNIGGVLSENLSVRNVNSTYEPEIVAMPPAEDIGLRPRPLTFSVVSCHLQAVDVLVHAENQSCKPILSIAEAHFPREIHKALFRCGFHDPMRIQKYVWPLILRGENVITVSPPHSGKTLAYAAPLVGFLLQSNTYKDMPEGCGPLVLIICSSSSSAQSVYSTCNELLAEDGKKITVLVTYGGGAEKEMMIPLANGCDILISTPRCLLRLINHLKITNLKRVVHLVLDEADVLSLKYLPEIKELLTLCYTILKKHKRESHEMQICAVAQKWCPALESLARNMPKSPTICIASYLEAAVYAKLQPCLHFVDEVQRLATVKEIMKKQQGLFKTVVVCQATSEVQEVAAALSSFGSKILMAHNDMPHFHIDEVHTAWTESRKPGKHPILVCSDDVLQDMHLRDAMWLVHYNLPSESKTVFASRFSCLVDNYPNLLKKNKQENHEVADCSVHILLDENNTQQLPQIVQFMKRLGAKISQNLESAVVEAQKKRELKKGHIPLCYNLKAFGDCWEKNSCSSRHIIRKEYDIPEYNLPLSGAVKLKILHVHDACNMSARLLEHTDLEGNTHVIKDQFVSIGFQMNSHYRKLENRNSHGIPKVNDVCAVESGLNLYKRAQVISITKLDNRDNPEEVEVRYMDDGNRELIKALTLFALPEDLQKIPPQVVEVFLCRLSPCDLDWNWGQAASLKVYDWLNDVNCGAEEDKYLLGKIAMSLGNTLWLDPIECRRTLPTVGTSSIVFSLRRNLLNSKLAVENPHHVQNLYKLCEQAGLGVFNSVTEMEEEVQGKQPKEPVKVQWAFIPSGDDFPLVFLASADNPGQLFLRLAQWEESLEKLSKRLQRVAEENRMHSEVFVPGDYCLGKFPEDGLWYRAQVTSVDGIELNLFFVDHGDRAKVQREDTVPIPEQWLLHLPFQAIECSLAGLKPIDNDWTESATNAIFKLTADEKDEKFVKPLYVKVCSKTKPALCTGGYRYYIVLMNTDGSAEIINQLLVDEGLATFLDDEKHYFENIVLPKPAAVLEDGDSDISDTEIVKPLDLSQNSVGLVLPDAEPCNLQLIVNNNENASVIENTLNDPMDFDLTNFDCDIEDVLHFLNCLKKQVQSSKIQNAVMSASHDIESEPSGEEYDASSEDSITVDATKSVQQEEEDSLPIRISTTRVPQVVWHQDKSSVRVKILLIGVEDYYLSWSVNSLKFCTKHSGEVYLVDMELYGAMDPQVLEHAAKGQYVLLKMCKLVPGYRWECLIKVDGKWPLWLKYDFENNSTEVDPLALAENLKKQFCVSPEPLEGNEEANIKADFMLNESEDELDSSSDILDPGDEQYDPFDPLS